MTTRSSTSASKLKRVPVLNRSWRQLLARTAALAPVSCAGARSARLFRPTSVWRVRVAWTAPLFLPVRFARCCRRDVHLLKPGSNCFPLRSLPNTVDFAFAQVGETLEAFDDWILLGSLGYLTILVASETLDCVGAHEFCHDLYVFLFLLFVFSSSHEGRGFSADWTGSRPVGRHSKCRSV
jgi:hypothetical protein